MAMLALGLLAAETAAAAPPPVGVVSQLSGTAGCFTYNGGSEDGAGTCSQATGIAEGESAVVSPDGANVYVGSYRNTGVPLLSSFTIFSRNPFTGALTQLPGTAGCLTSDGSSSAGPATCTKVRGAAEFFGDGRDVAFTSDGRWAYLVAQNQAPHAAVLIFQRDPSTGALSQLAGSAGCITFDGASQDGAGTCQTDPTINRVSGISISSDDRFLYAPDYNSPKRIHVFARDATTGALSEVQCISEAPAPAGCSTGRVLGNSEFVALSPDGRHAYGADYQSGLSVFDRDPSTGLLTQKAGTAGCITDSGKDDTAAVTCAVGRVVGGSYPPLLATNGATLYDPAGTDKGVSVFHINGDGTLTQLAGANGCITTTGNDNTGASTCAVGRALSLPYGGSVSADGQSLYVSDDSTVGGLAIFSLDPATGFATQLPGLAGCVTTDGSSSGTAGLCTDGTALANGYGMSLSPDGSTLYQATDHMTNAGLAVYARETAPVCSAVNRSTAYQSPASVKLACSDADGQPVSLSIASNPAHGMVGPINQASGTVTYTPAAGFHGSDGFTFTASDGTNTSAPTPAGITVGAPAPSIPPLISPAIVVAKFVLVGSPSASVNGVSFSLACRAAPGTPCRGLAQLTTLERLLGKTLLGVSARTKRHSKRVLIGSRSFSLTGGAQKKIVVPLNGTGRKLLARFHRVPATLKITLLNARPPTTITTKTTIRAKKKKKKTR